jgi:hypothetical protein
MCLKTKRLYARVTEAEMKIIEKKIKNGGYKNLSEYARDKVINKSIIEYDFGDINKRLSILGERLNHIVILCHQGAIDTIDLTWLNNEIKNLLNLLNEKENSWTVVLSNK